MNIAVWILERDNKMKTLVNKTNPQIRITAPEIEAQEEAEMYLIPVSDYCIPMYIDDWTLEEEPVKEEICSKCVYHGKDDGYCYNPYGGMKRRINENGVYECTGFCEKEQEEPKMDLEKEAVAFCFDNGINITPYQATRIARHFYELRFNARKEE